MKVNFRFLNLFYWTSICIHKYTLVWSTNISPKYWSKQQTFLLTKLISLFHFFLSRKNETFIKFYSEKRKLRDIISQFYFFFKRFFLQNSLLKNMIRNQPLRNKISWIQLMKCKSFLQIGMIVSTQRSFRNSFKLQGALRETFFSPAKKSNILDLEPKAESPWQPTAFSVVKGWCEHVI